MPDNRKTSLGIQLTDGSICEFIPPAPDATYRGGVTLEEKTKYDNYEGEINEIKEDLVQTESRLSESITEKIDKPKTTDDNKFPRAKNGSVEWAEQGLPTD